MLHPYVFDMTLAIGFEFTPRIHRDRPTQIGPHPAGGRVDGLLRTR